MAPITALPWMSPGGVTNFSRAEARSIARRLLSSDQYLVNLEKSLIDRSCPAAIEAMIWYYGYNKPAETVVMQATEDLSTLSTSELRKRAAAALATLNEAEALENAIDVEAQKTA